VYKRRVYFARLRIRGLCILNSWRISNAMARRTPIDHLIETKRNKIAAAERALDKLRIELTTLQQARDAFTADPGGKRPPSRSRSNGRHLEPRRRRGISDAWKRVLVCIDLKGTEGATTKEIAAFCAREGIEITRPSLRAQTFAYVKNGLLERVATGVFRLTTRGTEIADATQYEESRKAAGLPL
jgi:hypothetical protein